MLLNLRPRAAVFAVLVGVAIACRGDGTDSERSESVPAVAPFEGLGGVRLPTTLGDLAKARPQARPTNFGLREAVGGIDIFYVADREPGGEDYPGPKARVDHIEARWGAVSEDSATTLWRSSLEQLTGALGVSPECSHTGSPVVFAHWRTPSGAVAYLRRQYSVAGPVRQSASISIGFTVDTTMLDNEPAGATMTSCEDPYRP